METSNVQEFYNSNLKENAELYEKRRWFETAQKKAGYDATNTTISRYVPKLIAGKKHVFELGPGPGTWTKRLLSFAPEAHYDLVDISEQMLRQAKAALDEHEHVSLVVSDVLDFSEKDKYDFFFSSRMIEYVPDKEAALKQIAESLKSSATGFLITKTPQYKRIGSKKRQELHTYQVSPDELIDVCEKAGLKVVGRTHVTYVFPKLKSGLLDRCLYHLGRVSPFRLMQPVSESYALIFSKP